MSLIEQRHPRLGELMRLWRAGCGEAAAPPASALSSESLGGLAASTVLLKQVDRATAKLTIKASGTDVDALYGEPLEGCPAERLAPLRDVDAEAWSAIDAARPVAVEDDVQVGDRRRRIARLYLPLMRCDGSSDGVLCGIVAVV
jgi:hypothetical protein